MQEEIPESGELRGDSILHIKIPFMLSEFTVVPKIANMAVGFKFLVRGIKSIGRDGKTFIFLLRPRAGKNPQTGAVIDIAASNTVGFKPGKALRDAVG